jgi:hypothetical protein
MGVLLQPNKDFSLGDDIKSVTKIGVIRVSLHSQHILFTPVSELPLQ